MLPLVTNKQATCSAAVLQQELLSSLRSSSNTAFGFMTQFADNHAAAADQHQ
jgi:hypothetical protein